MIYFGSRYVLAATIVATLCGPAAHAQLSLQSPEGLVFQGNNILWVADYKAGTVQKVDVTNIDVPQVLCKISNLAGPTRLAISGQNVVVVNTIGKTVQMYSSTFPCPAVGNPLTGFTRPLGVAVSGCTTQSGAAGTVTIVIDNGTDEVWSFGPQPPAPLKQSVGAAPGAIAVTPAGVAPAGVVVGFGPTSGPSQVSEMTLAGSTCATPQLNLIAQLVSDSKNTGPTGLAFLPSPAGTTTRLLVSDLYSGNFAYYDCTLGINGSCGTPTAVSTGNGTGGIEGIAVNPADNDIFIANSTKGIITVYRPSDFAQVGTLPQP